MLVAPVLPGLSDGHEQLEEVVRACVEAGAVSVTPIVLHLRPGVRELFMPWLQGVRPDLVDRYERLYHRRAGYAHEHHARIAAHVQQLADQYGGATATPAAARGALTLLADAPARPSRRQADQLAIDLGAARLMPWSVPTSNDDAEIVIGAAGAADAAAVLALHREAGWTTQTLYGDVLVARDGDDVIAAIHLVSFRRATCSSGRWSCASTAGAVASERR